MYTLGLRALVVRLAVGLAPALLACPGLAAESKPAASASLRCGVVVEPLDWNKQDLHGGLLPLYTEMCRAVSAALLGAPDRFEAQLYNTEEDGLTGLQKAQSDIVVGVTPQSRAAALGVYFSLPFFQDAQGFMVHRAAGIQSVADIARHKLCYIEDTDNDPIVLSYLAAHGIQPVPFGFQEEGEMDAAIMDRHCQATSAMISKLAEARSTFHDHQDYVFLPERLTLVPVTIATGGHDPRLAAIANDAISALLQAEFLGVKKASADQVRHTEDKRMQRLTGEDWITAQGLGLPHDWAIRMIAAVGNYSEIFDRTVGPGTPLDLQRGENALWNQGGLMAPLPLR